MNIKVTQQHYLLAFGILIFTWAALAVFLIYQDVYRHRIEASMQLTQQSNETLKKIQEQRARCGAFLCYSGLEFQNLYNTYIDQESLVYETTDKITGDDFTDILLRMYAQERGYVKRSFIDESRLVEYNTLMILPEMRDAYISLRNRASRNGVDIHLVSAYRSYEDQRRLFVDQLENIDVSSVNDELKTVFERTAPPGYSKHHQGFAVDFACGDDYEVFDFENTPCYQWLSENNYEHAKSFGFIPSYPGDILLQGPEPEAWEYLYVGRSMIR